MNCPSDPESTRHILAEHGRRIVHLSQSGQFAQAIELAEQCVDMARHDLGEKDLLHARCLANLAVLQQAGGSKVAAIRLYRRALKIYCDISGEETTYYVNTLNALGMLHKEMGDPSAALPHLERALELAPATFGKTSPEIARSLNNLATLRQDLGDREAALKLYHRALEAYRTAVGEQHLDYAACLNNLGRLHHDRGEDGVALQLLNRAFEVTRANVGEHHPFYAGGLNNLAMLHGDMGDYATSLSFYHRALEAYRTAVGEQHADYARCLNNLATLYQTMDDYDAARPLFEQALMAYVSAVGEQHPDTLRCWTNLAAVIREMEGPACALPVLERVHELTLAAVGDSHPDLAPSLNILGAVHLDMGNHNASLQCYRRALEITETALGKGHPNYAEALNNIAVIYVEMGKYADALPLYRSALEITETALGENHSRHAVVLNNLAILLAAMGEKVEAIALGEKAWSINDRRLGQISSIASERQRREFLRTMFFDTSRMLSLLTLKDPCSQETARKALDLILRRKAIGVEALAIQRDALLERRYKDLKAPLAELADLRRRLVQEELKGPGMEGVSAHGKLLEDLRSLKDGLEAELSQKIPEMRLESRLRSVNAEAVAGALPPDAALVEIVSYCAYDFGAPPKDAKSASESTRYVAFVLPAGRPDAVRMIAVGEFGPIHHQLAAFLRIVSRAPDSPRARDLGEEERPPRPEDSDESGRALRRSLLDPLAEALQGRTRLILAPDGPLSLLPFEILPTDDGRRLIDVYSISYVGCGRDVLRFGTRTAVPASDPLVVADPDFDLSGGSQEAGSSSGRQEKIRGQSAERFGRQSREWKHASIHFRRLPGTRAEGERIGALLGVRPWLAGQALESRLRAGCRSPRILHIATHGFFFKDQASVPGAPGSGMFGSDAFGGRLRGQLPENSMLRSGLALAGANTWLRGSPTHPEAEDGLFCAEDVTGLDLLATELVVLSACDTGVGEVEVGEGVFGLRRSFQIAGAATVVMSLWKVADGPTQELMVDFYGRLLAGAGRAEALREAQLALRAVYPDPYFWGAFICQGDSTQ